MYRDYSDESILEYVEDDYGRANTLLNHLIARCTNGVYSERDYADLRKYFVHESDFKAFLPQWVREQHSLDHFWQFIKEKFAHYEERRKFLREAFTPLLDATETGDTQPSAETISDSISALQSSEVDRVWTQMLARVQNDPEGAITASRTLLETVCKHILDNRNISYDDSKIELSELYKLTSKELRLSPDQHSEKIFKQILGSCSGVVNGLGTIRNKLGDAHGKGIRGVRPKDRHARFVVNIAGATAQFLVETYHARNE